MSKNLQTLQALYHKRAELRAEIITLEASPELARAALAAQQQGKNDGERKALAAVLANEGSAGEVTQRLIAARAALARVEGEIEAAQEVRRAAEWEIRRQMVEALANRGYDDHDRDLTQAVEDVPLFHAPEDDYPF